MGSKANCGFADRVARAFGLHVVREAPGPLSRATDPRHVMGVEPEEAGPMQVQSAGQTRILDLERRKALAVGLALIVLPLLLVVLYAYAHVTGGCTFLSISHTYYLARIGEVTVGVLMAAGAVMIVFGGGNRLESTAALIAGIAAMGVAAFPVMGMPCTEGTGDLRLFLPLGAEWPVDAMSDAQFMNRPGWMHSVATVVLLLAMLYHAAWLFPRIEPHHIEPDGCLRPAKRRRNLIYLGSSLAIVGVAAAMGLQNAKVIDVTPWDGVFWAECVALLSFGVAWSVKGRVLPGFYDPDE
ncbi:MAG: hypothetical protein CSA72_07435 [Rhodobacterales bacterium]|nr:MAG: hypothetical protein CSA72_07435 [Rhodobacterales bacterium]